MELDQNQDMAAARPRLRSMPKAFDRVRFNLFPRGANGNNDSLTDGQRLPLSQARENCPSVRREHGRCPKHCSPRADL